MSKPMQRLFLHLAIAYTFLSPVASASTQSIVVARGNGNYFPNEMMNAENMLTGLHIDMLRMVAKEMNIDMKIKSLPWNRAVHFLEIGKVDAITYMGKSKKRERFALFEQGNILSVSNTAFFTLSSNSKDIKYSGNLRQLTGHTIGVISGYSYGNLFDDASFLTKDQGATSEETLLKKLQKKRISIGISDVNRMRHFIKQQKIQEKVVFLTPYLDSIPQYLAFSKKSTKKHLAKQFALHITQFKKSEPYQKLLKNMVYLILKKSLLN